MNKDKFVLVKGSSGLGNRMRCVLTGILYARLTGRTLLVDWNDDVYSNDGSNVFHRFFQCPLCDPTDQIPATDSVRPIIWRGHLHKSARHIVKHYATSESRQLLQTFSVDFRRSDYQEDVLVLWTYHDNVELLRKHFKGALKDFTQLSKDAIFRKLLQEDLVLHPEIRGRIDQFKENSFNGRTVGVHVRYSDHQASLWATLKNLNALLNREPGLQVFLATDNIQIKKMFEETYPGLITTPHWYSAPGMPLHRNPDCPDLFENGVEAAVDLYLLSECDYLVIDSSSSFGYLAKLLTKTPEEHVFEVKKKGKRHRSIRKLHWWLMFKLGLLSWGVTTLGKLVRVQKLFSR